MGAKADSDTAPALVEKPTIGQTTAMITHRILAFSLLVVLSFILPACDEAPRTVSRHHVEGAWSLAQGVMKDGPLLVVIEGAPFQQPGEQLEATVVGIMTGAVTWTASPRFTSQPTEGVSRSLRIVMTFNSPQETGAHEQCSGQSTGGGPLPEGNIRVLAAFCDAATILVSVSGEVADVTEINDPRFAALVRQVTLDMLTPRESGS